MSQPEQNIEEAKPEEAQNEESMPQGVDLAEAESEEKKEEGGEQKVEDQPKKEEAPKMKKEKPQKKEKHQKK